MLFRRRREAGPAGAATLVREDGDAQELLAQVEQLVESNRANRNPEQDRVILRLRHTAGARMVDSSAEPPSHPEPAPAPAAAESGLPEVSPAELTPELLRGAMLEYGCLIVRGVIDRSEAEEMIAEMERAFEARERVGEEGADDRAYWRRFDPDPPYELTDRDWVSASGSIWAADSPRLTFDMLNMFERVGLREVITGYLGERPAISVNKCTLRKVDASAGTAWHQDGAFLGDGVRALNVWMSLSDCGRDAPGLDIVARRVDYIVGPGGEGAIFEWSVSDQAARETAGEAGIVRPIIQPGDVVLFDDLCLHRTAVEPDMPGTRYAIESWFFGPSGFPDDYIPIAF